jgi:hypothetical protein
VSRKQESAARKRKSVSRQRKSVQEAPGCVQEANALVLTLISDHIVGALERLVLGALRREWRERERRGGEREREREDGRAARRNHPRAPLRVWGREMYVSIYLCIYLSLSVYISIYLTYLYLCLHLSIARLGQHRRAPRAPRPGSAQERLCFFNYTYMCIYI